MSSIWELDFYSRPLLDENKKKIWELLICESPTDTTADIDNLFQYSQFCPSTTVNSLWLKSAIEAALEKAPTPPKKIRFFRRQMKNMITKACEELEIEAIPSRRTYLLLYQLQQRLLSVYPQHPGYDPQAMSNESVGYPELNPIPLPDAIRGDKGDKWMFATLEADTFHTMAEWDIAFGEGFPLSLFDIKPSMPVPGLIIYSSRALPFAGWLSGIEISCLSLQEETKPILRMDTGGSDSWVFAALTTPELITEARAFELSKQQASGVHFLAIQANPESESFAGFWLLKQC